MEIKIYYPSILCKERPFRRVEEIARLRPAASANDYSWHVVTQIEKK